MSDSLQPALAGHYYASRAIFALERERIFYNSWQIAGTISSLSRPGDYTTIEVAGAALLIIRGDDGLLRAFRNVCPHRGSRLLEGSGANCREIRCPYHDWRFTLDGTLTDTPWFGEDSPFDLAQLSLVPASLEVWRGLVFVTIANKGSLARQLGGLPPHLTDVPIESMVEAAVHRRTAPINWKAYLDQFNEYYHSPVVHAPEKGAGLEHYSALPFEEGMIMQAPPGAAFYGGKWLWSWPNWTVSTFPGGAKISRVLPLSVDETEFLFIFLFSDMGEAATTNRERVIDATLHIFDEDIAAVGKVQSNFNAGFFEAPGPLHPRHEQATAYFQRKVRKALA